MRSQVLGRFTSRSPRNGGSANLDGGWWCTQMVGMYKVYEMKCDEMDTPPSHPRDCLRWSCYKINPSLLTIPEVDGAW